jgi:uncharacterized protein
MTPKFLPTREPIDSFGAGGFRFGGMSHQGAVLILPSGMRAWNVTSLAASTADDFAEFVRERNDIDMLLIGSGARMDVLPQTVRTLLFEHKIPYDVMTTSAAVHIYNVVVAEGRRVAAGLVTVADAKS